MNAPNWHIDEAFDRHDGLKEDRVWRDLFVEKMEQVPAEVRDICQYGFTEMLNNALDHSGCRSIEVQSECDGVKIDFWITDDGVGIFKKLSDALGTDDERDVFLELAKGKLTTEPEHHTGEGIFFTSRAFDQFWIFSGGTYYQLDNTREHDFIGGMSPPDEGTTVCLSIALNSNRTLSEIFDRYAADEDYAFSKTLVPVRLAQYGDELLVSRSQARRVSARFERFREVVLDFESVSRIGQSFADELFRVFANEHPEVVLKHTNANPAVEQMIRRAIGAGKTGRE